MMMMFYTQLFTSKRGSLAKIWLAAHWEKKLTKAHVFECNLENTIKEIISPKMKIGLRTSGHLLLGVVRIFSKKAKYLLDDCSDALVKIKVAFRPGETDLPLKGLEATRKSITLSEDFTSLDGQFPNLSSIDIVDHFSLNQSRSEEITLKEDFGNNFLTLLDYDDSQSHQIGLLDMTFQSLVQDGDAFGDEDAGCDLLALLFNASDHAASTEEAQNKDPQTSTHKCQQIDAGRNDLMEVEMPSVNETTLLTNEKEGFALDPVAVTPSSARKKGKRKRKLVVDQTKELTNEAIREQLADYSDMVASLDMAPPTRQLMQWKENGGAAKLLGQPCSAVITPQIKELFAKNISQMKPCRVSEQIDEMRHGECDVQRDTSALTTDNVIESLMDSDNTCNAELKDLNHTNDKHAGKISEFAQDENMSEFTHPELPSEDSLFVHPSWMEQETRSSTVHTQSMLDSQNLEERRMTRRTQKLLNTLKNHSNTDNSISLKALCGRCSRSRAATTFLCLLILKKQQAVQVQQCAPYEDIFITLQPEVSES